MYVLEFLLQIVNANRMFFDTFLEPIRIQVLLFQRFVKICLQTVNVNFIFISIYLNCQLLSNFNDKLSYKKVYDFMTTSRGSRTLFNFS